jgi:hypothetical protein
MVPRATNDPFSLSPSPDDLVGVLSCAANKQRGLCGVCERHLSTYAIQTPTLRLVEVHAGWLMPRRLGTDKSRSSLLGKGHGRSKMAQYDQHGR